ncbi:hypothetical protein [Cellulomonas hominis]
MQGMRIDVEDHVAVVLLDEVSDDLMQELRDRLSAYCYGSVATEEDADYYSFDRTIAELLVRYESKPLATRIGMAGELLVHVLVAHTHPALTNSAVFLNKEERSIKKGFDLTFHSGNEQAVWYGEVKSGVVKSDESADVKSAELLSTAALDIAGKLGKDVRRSRWDSALADVRVTLQSGQATSARALLRNDSVAAESGRLETKNVVVASVVMHAIDHCSVSGDNVRAVAARLRRGGGFSSVAVLAAQQHELESLIGHLKQVAADA